MSESHHPNPGRDRIVDGDWSATSRTEHQRNGPPAFTVTVAEGKDERAVWLSLTPRRARALIRLLTYMLEDAGERTRDFTTPWAEIRHKRGSEKGRGA